MRRAIEIAFAFTVLFVLSLPMLIIAVLVRLTSSGPALFAQQRVGMKGRLFRVYKFRSMTESNKKHPVLGLTRAGDHRITLLGGFIRKFKIDELPQFYNVLRGDMSLVGPRPKLPQYVALLNNPYRPGITGAATMVFRNEEELMRTIPQAELNEFYAQHIKPLKARLDACYMCRATPASDLHIILSTLIACFRPSAIPSAAESIPIVKAPRPIAGYGIAQQAGTSGND
jgi:lipopolysaccharide/colanic/teichoic acid biosynthesis glycosyltransferase